MSDILINEVMDPDDRRVFHRVEVFCEQRVNRALNSTEWTTSAAIISRHKEIALELRELASLTTRG